MSDDKDDVDPSDWLARQFQSDDDAKKPASEKPAAPPPPLVPPPLSPWMNSREPAEPAAVEPPASPAAPGGGFDWGFGRGTPATTPPAAEPPVTEPPAVEPPTVALPPVEPPTVAFPEFPRFTPAQAAAEPPASEPPASDPPAPDPALWGAPPQGAEPPTVALPWESAPEPIAAEAPTELIGAPANAADPANPLDSLFGDSAFKEYEDKGALATIPFAAGSGDGGDVVAPPRKKGDPLPRNQRILLWVAGSLVAVLALVALFFVGTRLPALLGSAPGPIASTTPTVTPTPTATVAAGPASVGVHKWTDLRGGECLSPFTSVWAETFTVVDCATPHPAQMVFRGTFPPTAAVPSTATPAPTGTATAAVDSYPGLAALQAQINLLCTTPSVINLAAAGAYTDIQFQGSYAATAQEWANGQHDYFCFISRKSGQPLTASVAAAH